MRIQSSTIRMQHTNIRKQFGHNTTQIRIQHEYYTDTRRMPIRYLNNTEILRLQDISQDENVTKTIRLQHTYDTDTMRVHCENNTQYDDKRETRMNHEYKRIHNDYNTSTNRIEYEYKRTWLR